MNLGFRRPKDGPPIDCATATFEIAGMHCGSCAMAVDWELEELTGVRRATTSLRKAQTTVVFDADRVAPAAMLAAIGRAGFTGRLVEPAEGDVAPARPYPAAQAATTESNAVSREGEPSMETITLNVPAITCDHCVATIKRVVTADVPGVASVSGDAATKQVTIDFDPPATVDQIVATMTEWDYPPAR